MENKQTKILIILNLIFLCLTILTDLLYLKLYNPYVFKTLASVTFVVWSLVNLSLMFAFKKTVNKKFMILMFIGQVFACAGDILLIDNFMVGAIAFAIGHIFFFVSYLFLQKFKLLDLIFIIIAIGISLAIIFISKINLGSMLPLIIAYAVVISTMLGKSITLFKGNKLQATVIFVGSLMFFLSDLFLMFTIFGGMGRVGDILCLAFYYPAEFVLASSIGVVGLTSKNNQ